MNIAFNQLQTFLVTAECSSFSAAAEKLYISHSAVIQQINLLEKALGFKLFVRSQRGIRLTESGEYFLAQYHLIQTQLDAVIAECIRREKSDSVLRIGNANDLHTFYLYSDFYHEFNKAFPNLSMEYVPTTNERVLEDCMSGRIDLGTYFGTSRRKKGLSLNFVPIHMELGILMNESHKLAGYEKLSIEELRGLDIFLSDIGSEESIYEQIPAVQESRLQGFYLTMDTIYKKMQNHELVILPRRFHRFFPNFVQLPLEPRAWFYTELVYRDDAKPEVAEYLEMYMAYEKEQEPEPGKITLDPKRRTAVREK